MSFFTLSEQLKEPYKGVFDRVYLYANVQEIPEEESNDAMLNLYDILFTAQAENKAVEQIVGDDIEVFCQSYFEQRKLYHFITSIPQRLYGLAFWIFGIELFFFGGDSLFGQVEGADVNLSPYLLGLLLSFLITPIGYLAYHFLIRKAGIKTVFFYGIMLAVSILFFISIFHLSSHFIVMGSRFWTIAIAATYVLTYKLWEIYQNYRKFGTWYNPDDRLLKQEMKAAKKTVFSNQLKKELHKIYARRFRKHLAKGNSSESFYQKLEKDLRRDKVIAKWYWLLGVVIVLFFVIPIYLKDSLVESLIFTAIEVAVVFPIVFYVRRLTTSGFPLRERWLEKAAPYRANLQEFFDQKEGDK